MSGHIWSIADPMPFGAEPVAILTRSPLRSGVKVDPGVFSLDARVVPAVQRTPLSDVC